MTSKIGSSSNHPILINDPKTRSDSSAKKTLNLNHPIKTQESAQSVSTKKIVAKKIISKSTSPSPKVKKTNSQSVKYAGVAPSFKEDFKVTEDDPENKSDIKHNNIVYYARRPSFPHLAPTSQASATQVASTTTATKKRKREEEAPSTSENSQSSDESSTNTHSSSSQSENMAMDSENSPELARHKDKRLKTQSEPERVATVFQAVSYAENKCQVIPMAYSGNSYEQALQFAQGILLLNKNKPREASGYVSMLVNGVKTNPKLREKIRNKRGTTPDEVKQIEEYQKLVKQISDYAAKRTAELTLTASMQVKIFQFKDRKFLLQTINNEQQENIVCLYKKMKEDKTEHYDVLISEKYSTPFSL